MVFTSHIFVFYFLPALLLVYYNLPYRARNVFLCLASYAFYGWWKPWFVTLMLASTVTDYIAGKVISAPGATRRRRLAALVVSCCVNLGLLGFFKYYMFATGSPNHLLALVGADAFSVLTVVLPVGISFYTFQTMSYTIDLYRGDARPAKSFFDFACFVSMFPQLIAGPIIRYHTVAEQLHSRAHTVNRFSAGTAIFILGFSKKILLANPMGEVADAVFGAANPLAGDAWFGVAAYAFQIYFDFSGYSDMAVGLGRMLGFEFPRNFDAPYRSQSITELWRRWHISLSTFLRDYLYVPLGGNRKGARRTYANLAIVMLLGGLWHGAQWQFVAWGAYHGTLLALERWRGKKSLYGGLPRPGRIAVTFVLMLFSWVLFRAENLSAAGGYFAAMFGLGESSGTGALLAAEIYNLRSIAVMAAAAILALQPVRAFDWARRPLTSPRVIVLLVLFTVSLMVMSTQAFNPFLYFQF